MRWSRQSSHTYGKVHPTPSTSVTIAITNYNYGSYLTAALDSVRAQTRPADRVIVIDDASTDPISKAILPRLDAEIELIRNPQNLGVVQTRNIVISRLVTTHVIFLDADDELLPNFVARVLAAYEAATIPPAIVYTSWRTIGLENETCRVRTWDPRRLAQFNQFCNTCLLSTESLRNVGGYSRELEGLGHEDWDLFLALAENGQVGVPVPEVLFMYRRHARGSRNTHSLQDVERVLDVMRRRHPWIVGPHHFSVWERVRARFAV